MEAHLRKVIEINPNHANALNYLGYSYAEKGIHLDEAQSLITAGVALNRTMDTSWTAWAGSFLNQGNTDEALKTLLRAAELVKDDPTVFEHIGDVYRAMDEKDKAGQYWKKALEFHKKGEDEGLKERVEKKILEVRWKKHDRQLLIPAASIQKLAVSKNTRKDQLVSQHHRSKR